MDLTHALGRDTPFREYRLADEAGIHRIFEETPMRVGGMELVYERRPRVQTQLEYQADKYGMLVADREGELRGFSSFSWGPRWVGGKLVSALYLGDFRVKFDRRIAAGWRSLYPRLLETFKKGAEFGPCEWFVTGILSQNTAAKKSLIENRKNFFYHLIAAPVMVNLFFRPRTRVGQFLPQGIRVVSGADIDESRLRQFLNQCHQRLFLGYDFGPDVGNEWDRRKRVWPEYASSAFLVALDQAGEIVGCTLPWAPTQAKRLRVNRLGRWASIGFKLLSVVGAKTPEIGKPFTTLYLTHLTFLPGMPRVTRAALIAAFIDVIFRQAKKREFHMLSYADPDELRKLAPLENYFAQTTPAEVYLVTTTPERPEVPPNDGVVFEMAII